MEGNKPLSEPESTILSDWEDLRSSNDASDRGGLDQLLENLAIKLKRRGYGKVKTCPKFQCIR